MAEIFICYRRNDSEGYAGRLHDHLVERFGARSVFVDVDNLHPGQDFAQVIQRTLQRSSVVLVVIGRHWMNQRLRNEGDYVRREIAAALNGRKRVIPVLVGDAQMPASDKLPPELAPLVGKQAIPLRHPTWKADVARLVTSLQRTLARKKATVAKDNTKPRPKPKKPTDGKNKDSTLSAAPRRSARTKQGGSETLPLKSTARRSKKTASAGTPRPAGEGEPRRRVDAAPDSRPQRPKRSTRKAADGSAGTSSRPAQASGKKSSGASARRMGGGGAGQPGGNSGERKGGSHAGKSGLKTPAAGRRGRRKKPAATGSAAP